MRQLKTKTLQQMVLVVIADPFLPLRLFLQHISNDREYIEEQHTLSLTSLIGT